jgi:hypothetical protein
MSLIGAYVLHSTAHRNSERFADVKVERRRDLSKPAPWEVICSSCQLLEAHEGNKFL